MYWDKRLNPLVTAKRLAKLIVPSYAEGGFNRLQLSERQERHLKLLVYLLRRGEAGTRHLYHINGSTGKPRPL